jgi:hypothetical protein
MGFGMAIPRFGSLKFEALGDYARCFSPIVLVALVIVIATSCGQMATSPTNTPSANCVPSTQPTFAYVLNYTDATISMYTANACTGALTAMNPATVPTGLDTGFNAESMAMDPTGRFLYVANYSHWTYRGVTVHLPRSDPSLEKHVTRKTRTLKTQDLVFFIRFRGPLGPNWTVDEIGSGVVHAGAEGAFLILRSWLLR